MEKRELIERRIEAFCHLGEWMRQCTADPDWQKTVRRSLAVNGFFTAENIERAVRQWAGLLTEEGLRSWLAPYMDRILAASPKKIALVMAGNIPIVGFHDYLSVLLCGYSAQVKLSSKDPFLLPFLNGRLGGGAEVAFTQAQVSGFDAIIATGSGNTFRYFDYYFGRYPHLLRKNRTSCAILNGNENREELAGLADDVFAYFGLGCRNVSKLYLPEGYDLTVLAEAFSMKTQDLVQNNSYKNNYDYYKSIYLVNRWPHLDTGTALLSESQRMDSPVSVVYYEYYKDIRKLQDFLVANQESLQCVIGEGQLPFGSAQQPGLSDWADGVDVLDFLLSL